MQPTILTARKSFSRVGFALVTLLGVTLVLQSAVTALLYLFFPKMAEEGWVVLLSSFLPQYAVALPLCVLVFCAVPETPIPPCAIAPKNLLVYLPVSIFMMYAGNLLGSAVTALLQLIPGVSAANPVAAMVEMDSPLLLAFITVVLAPMAEELIFRKLIIDRLHIYGGSLAVVFSAVLFGLFHGNFSQLFYAFTLGLVFAYLYLRTGRLRYSIFLHAFINFLGSVIAPLVLEAGESLPLESLSLHWTQTNESVFRVLLDVGKMLLLSAYSMAMLGAALAGLILLCMHIKKLPFDLAPQALAPQLRFRTAFINPGVLSFFVLCLIMIVASIFI